MDTNLMGSLTGYMIDCVSDWGGLNLSGCDWVVVDWVVGSLPDSDWMGGGLSELPVGI